MSNQNNEKLELLDRILERNLNWISSADSKGTQLFAVNSAMLAVLAALVPKMDAWTISASVFAVLSFVALSTSIVFVACANFPRLDGPRNSLMFFGGIAGHEEDKYIEKIMKGVTEELLEDWASQCHRNAEIALQKYQFIKKASIFQFVALPLWLVAIWLMYPLNA